LIDLNGKKLVMQGLTGAITTTTSKEECGRESRGERRKPFEPQ